ncbi:MAG: hypothetical protein KAS32_25305 [Candidatus Peribacteraceae bacterium]|nr:hypothetical protein [Candidatus Peribacteraceae bacterium]
MQMYKGREVPELKEFDEDSSLCDLTDCSHLACVNCAFSVSRGQVNGAKAAVIALSIFINKHNTKTKETP